MVTLILFSLGLYHITITYKGSLFATLITSLGTFISTILKKMILTL